MEYNSNKSIRQLNEALSMEGDDKFVIQNTEKDYLEFINRENTGLVTESEAISAIKSDSDWNADDWDTAFGWGDHSSAGYFVKATDTLDDITAGSTNIHLTTTLKSNYDAGYIHISNNGSDHSYIDQDITSGSTPTFDQLIINSTGTNNTSVVRYDQLMSVVGGLDWQDSVKDNDLTSPPGGASEGDRYIVASGGSGDWSGQDNNIAEYNGSGWDFTVPNEGFTCWIEDEDTNFTYNGTAWVEFGSTVSHNNTTGLQGGTNSQYYHLNSAQHTEITTFFGSTDITGAQAETLSDGSNADSLHIHTMASGISDEANYLLTDGSRNLGGNWNLGGYNLTNGGSIAGSTLTDGTAALTGGSLTSVKLGSLTNNGFVTTSNGDGTLSIDTTSYIEDTIDIIKDTHIDWGTGANQVSAIDVPIADDDSKINATDVENALQENRTAINLNTSKTTESTTVNDTNTVDLTLSNYDITADVLYQNTTTIDLSDDASGLKADLDSTLKSNYDSAYSHITADGSSHSYIDQDVTISSSPTFDGSNFTGIPNGALDETYIKANGTVALTSNWDIGDGYRIETDEIRARNGAGLKLYDDASNGIFIKDSGLVGIGTEIPEEKLHLTGDFLMANGNNDAFQWWEDTGNDVAWRIGQRHTLMGELQISRYDGSRTNFQEHSLTIYANDNIKIHNGDLDIPNGKIIAQAPTFFAYKNAVSSGFTTTAYSIEWDVVQTKDSDFFSHTTGNETITLEKAGEYELSYAVPIDIDTGSSRSTSVVWATLNTVAIAGSGATGYHRTDGVGDDTVTKTIRFTSSAGDYFLLRARRYTGSDTLMTQYDATYSITPTITLKYLG